jgi:hypothetical protein
MSLCNDPYSVVNIDLDEYVGTSLFTINTNFEKLKTEVCRLEGEINILEPDYLTFNTGLCALSAMRPGFAKAWVRFNGIGTGNLSVYSNYNVPSVSGSGSGSYRINFSPSFTGTNYVLVGTCDQTTQSNNYGWVSIVENSFTTNSVIINIRNTAGSITTANNINILAYDI